MQNCISCHHVADFFLLKIDQNAGDSITNLKLQKLCYYAQAWHLALFGKKLFEGKIEAWAHGPVVPELYNRFKKYKWECIDALDTKTDPYSDLHWDDLEFLDMVWEKYGSFSGITLEKMTHKEDPWKLAYGDRPYGSRCDVEITAESMEKYYKGQLNSAA